MFIICLDIDDTVIDYNIEDEDERIFNLIGSLLNIRDLLNKIDGEVYLTSTWSKLVRYHRGEILLDIDNSKIDVKTLDDILIVVSSLKTIFDDRWYGISSGNRIRDMKKLLEDGNTVICLDDMDMSEIKHERYMWYKMSGVFNVSDRYELMRRIERTFY